MFRHSFTIVLSLRVMIERNCSSIDHPRRMPVNGCARLCLCSLRNSMVWIRFWIDDHRHDFSATSQYGLSHVRSCYESCGRQSTGPFVRCVSRYQRGIHDTTERKTHCTSYLGQIPFAARPIPLILSPLPCVCRSLSPISAGP